MNEKNKPPIMIDIDGVITGDFEFFKNFTHEMKKHYHIVILTGRSIRHKRVTEKLLKKLEIYYEELVMFDGDGYDLTEQAKWKADMCDEYGAYWIIDDSPEVFNEVRSRCSTLVFYRK